MHASMRQLLARFPAAVPALLEGPQPQLQGSPAALPAAAADTAAAGPPDDMVDGAVQALGPPAAAARVETVALVFGREESGLLESELLLCSHACAIPTGRTQPSLNLSHAAAVVLSQLFDLKQQRLLQLEAGGGSWEEEQQPGLSVDALLPGVGSTAASGSLFEDGEANFFLLSAGCHLDALSAARLKHRVCASEDAESCSKQCKFAGQWHSQAPVTRLPAPSLPAERVRWRREQALSPASQAELEALLSRAAALLEAAGIRRVPRWQQKFRVEGQWACWER